MTSVELEKCITEYGTDIFSFCKSLTLDVGEAEELYQDTFLKASELREKIDEQGNIDGF